MYITGSNAAIQGNYLGLKADGVNGLPNTGTGPFGGYGIYVAAASNVIGGYARNLEDPTPVFYGRGVAPPNAANDYDAQKQLVKVGFSLPGDGVLDAWAYRDAAGQMPGRRRAEGERAGSDSQQLELPPGARHRRTLDLQSGGSRSAALHRDLLELAIGHKTDPLSVR